MRRWACKHSPLLTLSADVLVVPAVGDLHGDMSKAKKAFQLARLAAEKEGGKLVWTGGDTVVVQLGDVLDRGDCEIGMSGREPTCIEAGMFSNTVYLLCDALTEPSVPCLGQIANQTLLDQVCAVPDARLAGPACTHNTYAACRLPPFLSAQALCVC